MEAKWICISVDPQCSKGNGVRTTVEKELNNIFGKDLIDVVFVGSYLSNEYYEMQVENYIFVKCLNYYNHIEKLKQSSIIFGVLDSYDHPSYVGENEVYQFRATVKRKTTDSNITLSVGDKVEVREGYLKDLNGVVVKIISSNKCKVFFKFYTRSFVEIIWRSNLIYSGSIFEHIKFPVVYEKGSKSKAKTKSKKISPSAAEAFNETVKDDK